jgi:hypothetical protein
MKKSFLFILCASFLLASCAGNSASSSNSGDTTNSSPSSSNSSSIENDEEYSSFEEEISESTSSEETEVKNKIDKTKNSDARPFSEGKTFVSYKGMENLSTEYCIDKEGNILFSVELGMLNESPGFHNGIATFRGPDPHGLCFCDEEGNITTPADLGADEFLFDTFPETDPGLPFADGYFFARKTESSFEGNVHKAAIFNYKFEKLVDFSTEIFDLYTKYIKELECSYYDGYLYCIREGENEEFIFNCLDLRTGKETHDYETVLNKITINNPSDFWYKDWDGTTYKYVDMITGETVIDLSKYPTINEAGDFKNGLAPIFFEVDDEVGTTNYFTILKEDGSFAFEPIEIGLPWGYRENNGVYLIPNFIDNDTSKLLTFDINGKIAETVCTIGNPGNCYFAFSDGVINVDGRYEGFEFYDINLQPLF